jgi:hypothetical protein
MALPDDCSPERTLAGAAIIYDSGTGNPANTNEILKRRKRNYGNSKVLCPAAIALPIW